jgi:hypothetical protein
LPDQMRVEVDPDIDVRARTVGELRKVRHGRRIWRSSSHTIVLPEARLR